MPNPGEAQPFSWKRAAAHAGVPLGLALLGFALFGAETGRLMVPVPLLALLTSFLVQTGRAISGWICGVLTMAVLVGAVVAPIVAERRAHPVALQPSDRAPLELVDIGGAPHFRHPHLRFAFPQPGPGYRLDDRLQASTSASLSLGESGYVYAIAESLAGSNLLVILHKANRIDRDQLEGFVRGLANLGTDPAIRELENHVVWEPSFRGAHLHYVIAESSHLRVFAQVDDFGTDAEYIVALVALSPGGDDLAATLDGFRARDPRTR